MKRLKLKFRKVVFIFMLVYGGCILVNQQLKINSIKSESIIYQGELKSLQEKNQKVTG